MSEQERKTSFRQGFNTRGFTSLLLTFCFVVICVTGVILYIAPKGRVAHWSNWTILGLEKEQWAAVHINSSLVLVIAAVLHLCFNWKPLLSYIKSKATSGLKFRLELPIALISVGILVAGIVLNVPPFRSVMALNDRFKMYWADRSPQAPVPHSEELSLNEFAEEVNLNAQEMIKALEGEGITTNNAQVTLKELASQKGMAPSELYAVIKKHFPATGVVPGRGRGLGRRLRQSSGVRME